MPFGWGGGGLSFCFSCSLGYIFLRGVLLFFFVREGWGRGFKCLIKELWVERGVSGLKGDSNAYRAS